MFFWLLVAAVVLRAVENSTFFDYSSKATIFSRTSINELVKKTRALWLGQTLQRVKLALKQVYVRVVSLMRPFRSSSFVIFFWDRGCPRIARARLSLLL